jgi:hypothetical protein
MHYLHYALLGGTDRARAQFVLSSRRWFPTPDGLDSIMSVSTQEMWSSKPRTNVDADGAVHGARSGYLVPLHDQAPGRYGVDSRRINQRDREPMPGDPDLEDYF